MFAPSDLRQYDYAVSHHSGIISHFPKRSDSAKPLAAALVAQDLPPFEPTEPPPQKKPKVSSVKVWPRVESKRTQLYQPDKPKDDDAAPSME